MTLEGKRYVLVPEAEFDELTKERDVPELPPVDADGTMDAVAFADAAIARGLAARREAAGLTRQELARAAGVKLTAVDRAERGTALPGVRTLPKARRRDRAGQAGPQPGDVTGGRTNGGGA